MTKKLNLKNHPNALEIRCIGKLLFRLVGPFLIVLVFLRLKIENICTSIFCHIAFFTDFERCLLEN